MAEGFEPYHVPQQSRRDKLRVVAQNHHHPGSGEPATTGLQACTGLFPLYDPSLQLTSDLLCCAPHNFHHNHHQGSVVKEEGANLMMGYIGGGLMSPPSSSSASQQQHPYLDLQSSLHMNPSSIHDLTNNFPYIPHHLREFDHEFNGGGGGGTGGDEVVVYKPEPLSLTHDQSNATVGGQGLSLSLSSHPHPHHIHTHHQPNLPLELNLQRCYETCTTVVPTILGATGSTSNDVSRRPVPLGPFTGYASILKGSRFLRPAQQLLEEFCDLGRGTYAEKISADASLMDPNCMESFSKNDDSLCCGDGGDVRGKKSRLISLLDEVFRKYKQYYQQMEAVVASFESVAGLSNAAPYVNLAIKVMSKHFRCLKNAITEQLQCTNKVHGHMSQGKDEAPNGISDRGFYGQRPPIQNSEFNEHQPVWRPQRGLPERAVTVLRAWLFEHFLHPYPTDTDKLMLAKQTGLSRNQVSNWFINARVRLWKPMVEEIHMLETRQTQKTSPREERNDNRSTDPLRLANSLASENPSTSTQRFQDTPSKRTRNELLHIPVGSEEPMNVAYNNFSSHPNVGVGMSTAAGGSGVSLTLGLHQNNGMGLSEPFSINAAQRFGLGLDTNSDGYVMAGLEAPNRHFGRDVMGGQLLHDFVG